MLQDPTTWSRAYLSYLSGINEDLLDAKLVDMEMFPEENSQLAKLRPRDQRIPNADNGQVFLDILELYEYHVDEGAGRWFTCSHGGHSVPFYDKPSFDIMEQFESGELFKTLKSLIKSEHFWFFLLQLPLDSNYVTKFYEQQSIQSLLIYLFNISTNFSYWKIYDEMQSFFCRPTWESSHV